MSIDSIKRNILFFSVIGITLIGIFSYNSYHKMTFQRDADQLTENSMKLSAISYKMCESLSFVWSEYDFGNHFFDTQTGKTDYCNTGNRANNLVYCSSPSELHLQQEQFFNSTGIVDLLDKYKNNMEIAFKRLESAQGKYKNAFTALQQVYCTSSLLYDYATKPYGTLQNYSSSVRSQYYSARTAFRDLDFEMCPIFNERAEEYQRSANDEFFKKTGIECEDFFVF